MWSSKRRNISLILTSKFPLEGILNVATEVRVIRMQSICYSQTTIRSRIQKPRKAFTIEDSICFGIVKTVSQGNILDSKEIINFSQNRRYEVDSNHIPLYYLFAFLHCELCHLFPQILKLIFYFIFYYLKSSIFPIENLSLRQSAYDVNLLLLTFIFKMKTTEHL